MADDPPAPPRFAAEFGKDGLPSAEADGRLDAPAFHRNHEAIGKLIASFLEDRAGNVLEIGSGAGQHGVAFARLMPAITWWPTDFTESHLRSIEAWRQHARLANLKSPIHLDASVSDWRLAERGFPTSYRLIFCANVIHIA